MPKTKQCTICKKRQLLSKFPKRKNTYRSTCRKCGAEKRKEYRYKVRLTVFTHYGACQCCGENNILFLTLDHINNDGAHHRRQIAKKSKTKRLLTGEDFYRWVIKNNYPTYLQSLCWNCNSGRHYNSGVCPHKQKCDIV